MIVQTELREFLPIDFTETGSNVEQKDRQST